MNNFGGNWTYQKIRIVESYSKAYLQIMKEHPYWKLMYFDGFAGSGEITMKGNMSASTIDGAAKTILAISYPRMFDMYYFVELNEAKAQQLKKSLDQVRKSGVYVVSDDCNVKLIKLAKYLQKEEGKDYKVLAFIDPCGMNVNWSSIEALKGLGVDLWILVPTGLGVNRLLKKDGNIPEAWLSKLETFFGIDRNLLIRSVYEEVTTTDLFGEVRTETVKNKNSAQIIRDTYVQKMHEIFKFVSNPYELRNSKSSIMFHFFLASNNQAAVKIANDIIKKLKHDPNG